MAPTRREILTNAAVATAMAAAAPGVLAQQPAPGATAGSFFQRGPVRIHYEDTGGNGFPLLLIAGGGLNSVAAGLHTNPFNAIDEFKSEFRCVGADLRNAIPGQSTGPLEVDRPWDSHTDDQLALMDHIGANKFMVMGFCIGGPFIWNLLKRAPDRVVAAVLAQPVGFRPENPTVLYDGSKYRLGSRPPEAPPRYHPSDGRELSAEYVHQECRLRVHRDARFRPQLPDSSADHARRHTGTSLRGGHGSARCSHPNAEVSMYPWKEPKERIPIAVRQIRSFLRAHRPLTA